MQCVCIDISCEITFFDFIEDVELNMQFQHNRIPLNTQIDWFTISWSLHFRDVKSMDFLFFIQQLGYRVEIAISQQILERIIQQFLDKIMYTTKQIRKDVYLIRQIVSNL